MLCVVSILILQRYETRNRNQTPHRSLLVLSYCGTGINRMGNLDDEQMNHIPFTNQFLSENLTGRRQGKLAVLGLSDSGKLRWVCQCDCGNLVIRKPQALLNAKNTVDACDQCRKTPPREILEPIAPVKNKPPERRGCGKMCFASESAIKKAIKSRLRKGANCGKLRSYFCKDCKAFHMSSVFRNK